MGKALGILTLIAVIAAIMNFVVKAVMKNYGKDLDKNGIEYKALVVARNIFVKYHRLWGALAIFSMFGHVIIQFSKYGPNLTGMIAAISLIAMGVTGWLTANNRSNSSYIKIHRILAIILVIAIFIHIL